MVEDGENVLAVEHKFNLLERLLMKFCSVRNHLSFLTDATNSPMDES